MLFRIFLFILGYIGILGQSVYAASAIDNDVNIRNVSISGGGQTNSVLDSFVNGSSIRNFFFTPSGLSGEDGILEMFTVVAFNLKNIVIVLALIFLAIGIIKLLFSSNDEESVKKWRSNIVWVTVGIFIMQIVFSIWSALILDTPTTRGFDGNLGWAIWVRIFAPIVGVLQLLASFGFLLMAVYAFYLIVGGGGDEEKVKKGRRTIIYGLVGFLLMKVPQAIISAFYGRPVDGVNGSCGNIVTLGSCDIGEQNLTGAVGIIGQIIIYANSFLALICVILIIYAGWLVLISGGDEEKLKKAKSTILYVFVGFIVLVASHAIFRFFILGS